LEVITILTGVDRNQIQTTPIAQNEGKHHSGKDFLETVYFLGCCCCCYSADDLADCM